jgi:hypothetical protein
MVNRHIFSYPDYTVGPGISPDLLTLHGCRRSRAFTAGGESHPALKTYALLHPDYTAGTLPSAFLISPLQSTSDCCRPANQNSHHQISPRRKRLMGIAPVPGLSLLVFISRCGVIQSVRITFPCNIFLPKAFKPDGFSFRLGLDSQAWDVSAGRLRCSHWFNSSVIVGRPPE